MRTKTKTPPLAADRRSPTKTPILIHLDAPLLKAVDTFRFRRRFPSRAEAIRTLLRTALQNPTKGGK